jgi:hypothetical protein
MNRWRHRFVRRLFLTIARPVNAAKELIGRIEAALDEKP